MLGPKLSGRTKGFLAEFLEASLSHSELSLVARKADVLDEVLRRVHGRNKLQKILSIIDLTEELSPSRAQQIILNLFKITIAEHHGAEKAAIQYAKLKNSLLSDGFTSILQETNASGNGEQSVTSSSRTRLFEKERERKKVLEAAVALSDAESPSTIVQFGSSDLASTGFSVNQIDEALHRLAQEGLLKKKGINPEMYQLTLSGRKRFEEDILASVHEVNSTTTPSPFMNKPQPAPDSRKVFVIHGRNETARKAMFAFLRSLHLEPIEWSKARSMTGKASPYIGEILDAAFGGASAVVALFTGDDEARLRPHLRISGETEEALTPQARPNVLFEAGMAMGRHPERTIFVELGQLRGFSDIAGVHVVRLSNNLKHRQDLAQRLLTAGCAVDLVGTDWHDAGDFDGLS